MKNAIALLSNHLDRIYQAQMKGTLGQEEGDRMFAMATAAREAAKQSWAEYTGHKTPSVPKGLKSIPARYRGVAKEVLAAYTEETRNLNFRASDSVPSEIAVQIMDLALKGQGYNGFDPQALLNVQGHVVLAREDSVCVYVTPGSVAQGVMGEDEYGLFGRELRIWWD